MSALSGITPQWVHPLEPEFTNVITESEGHIKQYQNLSTTPLLKWKLIWSGVTDDQFWKIHKHFYDQKAGYSKFAWKDVPSYIDTNMDGSPDGSDVTVRYIAGTFKFTPKAKSWDAEVVVEKDN